jgi:hypothetical protein
MASKLLFKVDILEETSPIIAIKWSGKQIY